MISLLLAGNILCAQSGDTLLGTRTLSAFESAARFSFRGDHRSADSVVRRFEGASRPEGRLLSATAALAAFADLHDPARLESAREAIGLLERSVNGKGDTRSRLIAALGKSQESYLASLEGRNLASALAGRSAASIAQDLLDQGCTAPEAKGIVGGYLFWKSQSLGSLGRLFGGDQREKGVALSREAAESRSPFHEAFRTSLLWIRFERGEYPEALRLARAARAEWPADRLYRQAEGDVLFRMRRFQEALDIYRTSFLEFRGVEVLPANRLAAAGNLARIHAAMGRDDSARAWLDTLDASRYVKVRRWLPPSLVRELEPVRRKLSSR